MSAVAEQRMQFIPYLWSCNQITWAVVQAAAIKQAAALEQALVTCQAEAAAQLSAESARRAQAEEAVEQYIAAHYASQTAAQVSTWRAGDCYMTHSS